ncbi:MAG: aminotransferase class V-fold PLP-dependent enzyme [Nannocystaceae bacterium]|nr:aminotransferase class V-fold PLP-dependent enzyme [bacterium]
MWVRRAVTRRRYLNQAGTSWPKAPGVLDAVQQTLRVDPARYAELFVEARERIAGVLGIASPEALLLTPGCTSAIAAVLLSRSWQPGDVVLTSAMEHQAMLTPIEALVRHRGVEHYRVASRAGEPFDLDALRDRLATGRVRAVAITAASNVTGERLPVEGITAAARDAGAFSLVDAAQTAGLVHLDLPSLGADAVAFAGHKGPLAPQGIGGLWIRDQKGFAAPPGYCDLGSVNLPGAVAMATSLEWLASTPTHRRRPIDLRHRLREALRARDDCTVFGGDGPSTSAVSFLHTRLEIDDAEEHFAAHGIVVRAGRHCAGQHLHGLDAPDGTIRVSFGVFNRDDDVDAVLEALDAAR